IPMLDAQRPKILLDECLSPQVARQLCLAGWDAIHVQERKLDGKSDAVVFKWAFANDRVVLTANFNDFEKLARSTALHCGVIGFANGEMTRKEQKKYIPAALTKICEKVPDPLDFVGRVILV